MSSTTSRPKTAPSVIGLVDADTFYVSAERVFAPHLAGKPVVVLSNNDGCVVARSNEVKALGVAMGTPVHEIRALIRQHGIHVYSSNYSLYGDLSARMMTVLEQFAPRVEVYSIDEAFLDLTGLADPALLTHAQGIAKTVRRWLGLPISIGIGPTKVLAKVANRLAKNQQVPGGVVVLLDTDRPGLTHEMCLGH